MRQGVKPKQPEHLVRGPSTGQKRGCQVPSQHTVAATAGFFRDPEGHTQETELQKWKCLVD